MPVVNAGKLIKSGLREKGELMELRSRIYASSDGHTIDALGEGRYLVCNASFCVMVKGLHQAHITLKHQQKVVY